MFFCILFSYTILRDTKDVLVRPALPVHALARNSRHGAGKQVVTAPGGSAEVIPFLKTWVNLPGAILFTIGYSALSNRLGCATPRAPAAPSPETVLSDRRPSCGRREALFYATLTPFLAFFASFAWIIYPLRNFLHPTALCDKLSLLLPLGFAAPIAVFRNWTFSLFYLLANMWGSVVVSLLFWGFANEICSVSEAKRWYSQLASTRGFPQRK